MDDVPGEAEDLDLVERARNGDKSAVTELWTRHYGAVLSYARRTAPQPRDAEEIASDAFSGMLSAIAGGAGPSGSVRAYLTASVRNASARASRGSAKVLMTSDDYVLDAAASNDRDDPVAKFAELGLVREAFAGLPQRWQIVLWRTVVDHDSNIDVAKEMGMSPNAVAALSRRARQAFRVAYLKAHLAAKGVERDCEPFVGRLADYALTGGDRGDALSRHVRSCEHCSRRVAELRAVDGQLAVVLGPAILGLIPSGMLAGGAAGAVPGSGAASAALHAHHAGRWVAASVVAVGTAAALIWWMHGDDVPVAAPLTTSVVPTQSVTPPAVTSTTPRSTTSHPPPPRLVVPRVHTPPAPTLRTPAAPTRPRPTTSPPARTTPLTLTLGMAGSASDTAVSIAASAQGISGPLHLQLTVPSGVILTGHNGDWSSCTQSGATISCTAASTPSGRWAGTIHTSWAAGARGRVTAEVTGQYSHGSPASATVGTTWPP